MISRCTRDPGGLADEPDYPAMLAGVVTALAGGDRRLAQSRLEPFAYRPAPRSGRKNPSPRQLAELYDRDRYQCRYCGRRTVLTPVMRLVSVAFPDLFPYHRNWKAGYTHPAVAAVSATHDHVQPVTLGGDADDPANLVTACWVCNAAKGNLSLHQLGWTLHEPADSLWRGLADLYWPLWEALRRPTLGANERAWLRATTVLYGTHTATSR